MPVRQMVNAGPFRNESLTAFGNAGLTALVRVFDRIVRGADPYGIDAALKRRKANREAYRAVERSEASRKGWQTRRAA